MKIDIDKKLLKIILSKSKTELMEDSINDTTDLMSDLGIDSVKMLDLIVEVEETFNIEFGDNDLDLENIVIYKGLKQIIEQKLG